MKRITYKVVFNIKKKLNKAGEAPIYIRVTIERKSYYLNTEEYISPKFWNNNKGEVSAAYYRSLEINTAVNNMISKMKNYVIEIKQRNELIKFSDLIALFELKPKVITSFLEFYELELQNRNDIEKGTLRNHTRTLEILCEYRPQISFDDLKFELIKNFDHFLINKKLSTNTRYKYHKNIKTYLNLAINKGLFSRDKNPYNTFKVQKEGTYRESLTLNEIERIELLNFEPGYEHLEKVKDIFLFSCYTGLRFSDVMQLNKSHLHIENDKMNLSLKMMKTKRKGKYVHQPLHDMYDGKPKLIIEKYLAKNSAKNGKIFEALTDQYTNRALSEIAKLAKINKHLTYHVSRHSFGTNGAEILGDPTLLKELMGHSKLETTMIYIQKSPERIEKQIKNVNWNKNKN